MSDMGETHQRLSLSFPNIQGDFSGSKPHHFVSRITSEIYGKHPDLITPQARWSEGLVYFYCED